MRGLYEKSRVIVSTMKHNKTKIYLRQLRQPKLCYIDDVNYLRIVNWSLGLIALDFAIQVRGECMELFR